MSGSSDQSPVGRTKKMWESGESIPSIEILVNSISGGTIAERAEAVVVDQQIRWKRGMSVSAEHYLHRCPDLAADAESRRRIVMAEFQARGGGAALLPEFVQRFPGLEEELRASLS